MEPLTPPPSYDEGTSSDDGGGKLLRDMRSPADHE